MPHRPHVSQRLNSTQLTSVVLTRRLDQADAMACKTSTIQILSVRVVAISVAVTKLWNFLKSGCRAYFSWRNKVKKYLFHD
jgi:hypothetical protein